MEALLACRVIRERTYELTMMSAGGKERLIEGLKIRDMTVVAKELREKEAVVSFLNLLAYILDEDIMDKLKTWGVMWPGSKIADGTRFLKVRFNKTSTISAIFYQVQYT